MVYWSVNSAEKLKYIPLKLFVSAFDFYFYDIFLIVAPSQRFFCILVKRIVIFLQVSECLKFTYSLCILHFFNEPAILCAFSADISLLSFNLGT